jgi:hypothetical protein
MELARCMSELSQDQAVPLAAATALFRPCPHKSRQHNARRMAPAITRIVVRSMFIDYLSSRQSRAGIIRDPRQDAR